jgi:protein SCO1
MTPQPAIAEGAPGPSRFALLGLAAIALAGPLMLGGALFLRSRAAPEPLPVLGAVPTFSLTAETGQPLGSAELAGKPWVANFIFTRCTTICPPFTKKMQAVAQRALPGVRLLSFSVDPEHDTPEKLFAYAKEWNTDPAQWSFVTGSREQLEAVVVKGLFQPMDKGDGSLISIGHSNRFVVVDGRGQIRAFIPSNEEGAVDRAVAAAATLLEESRR